jgi:signal transduction histidine kinase
VWKRNEILDVPGASFSFNQRRLSKNKNWIWCEGTVTNLLHEPGIMAMVSNFRDISEKKAAEQQREFDRKNLDALINNTSDLMWSVDREYKLITSNKPFELAIEQLGRGIKKGAEVLTYASSTEHADRFRTVYDRAFEGKAFIIVEHNTVPAESWLEISYTPIWKDNEVIGAACHGRNITERKLAENLLRKANDELQKTNVELDRFVYSASHDLRSPLTSILGLLQFIERESLEPATLEYAKMIRQSINRLDEFIKNILSYSRNHGAELEVSQINFKPLIQNVVNGLSNMKEAQGIDLLIKVNDSHAFYSDPQRLSIILENLISNAMKFRDELRADKFIRILATVHPKYLDLRVEDNGIGISREYHEKIFNMFFRLSNQKAGSGIGLYIVKETVEKLEGSIKVSSDPLVMTCFSLQLKNFSTSD